MARLSRFPASFIYVSTITAIGVILHGLGALDMGIGDAPRSAHYLMLGIDSFVLIGLLLRKKWGYYSAVALFSYGAGSQTYWTVEAVLRHLDKPLLQGLMASLTVIALGLLVREKGSFLRRE